MVCDPYSLQLHSLVIKYYASQLLCMFSIAVSCVISFVVLFLVQSVSWVCFLPVFILFLQFFYCVIDFCKPQSLSQFWSSWFIILFHNFPFLISRVNFTIYNITVCLPTYSILSWHTIYPVDHYIHKLNRQPLRGLLGSQSCKWTATSFLHMLNTLFHYGLMFVTRDNICMYITLSTVFFQTTEGIVCHNSSNSEPMVFISLYHFVNTWEYCFCS